MVNYYLYKNKIKERLENYYGNNVSKIKDLKRFDGNILNPNWDKIIPKGLYDSFLKILIDNCKYPIKDEFYDINLNNEGKDNLGEKIQCIEEIYTILFKYIAIMFGYVKYVWRFRDVINFIDRCPKNNRIINQRSYSKIKCLIFKKVLKKEYIGTNWDKRISIYSYNEENIYLFKQGIILVLNLEEIIDNIGINVNEFKIFGGEGSQQITNTIWEEIKSEDNFINFKVKGKRNLKRFKTVKVISKYIEDAKRKAPESLCSANDVADKIVKRYEGKDKYDYLPKKETIRKNYIGEIFKCDGEEYDCRIES
ncbi:MAG: hypothetical protein K9M80_07625 [Candidatus Marinimicrobia bacterium]|nr:hypothetical protein [Candidatus Neomarinimicrobiota bacterium]